jgi:hypothetical protein
LDRLLCDQLEHDHEWTFWTNSAVSTFAAERFSDEVISSGSNSELHEYIYRVVDEYLGPTSA